MAHTLVTTPGPQVNNLSRIKFMYANKGLFEFKFKIIISINNSTQLIKLVNHANLGKVAREGTKRHICPWLPK